MISYAKFLLGGWFFRLDIAVNFAADLVVKNSLEFCDLLKRLFVANVFRFWSHYFFRFHQIWWAESRRGTNLTCLVDFFPEFGGLGCIFNLVEAQIWQSGYIGAWFSRIGRSKLRRGADLGRGQWRQFDNQFVWIKSCLLMRTIVEPWLSRGLTSYIN